MSLKPEWIWAPGGETVNAYARFRREFDAPGGKARVRVSADGEYALWLNGAFLGCGQYGDLPTYKVYDEYEVTLSEGPNALEITGYCPGVDFSTYRAGSPKVWFTVEKDGETLAASDPNTLAAPDTAYRSGPIEKITGQLNFSFEYDARFTPGPWQRAAKVEGPQKLYLRPVKKLTICPKSPSRVEAAGAYREDDKKGTPAERMQRAYLSFRPVDRAALTGEVGVLAQGGEEGTYVLMDLGQEEAGLFTMDVEVDEPCDIMIGWGEHTADLRLRTSMGNRNFGALYRARAGRQSFTHYFRRLGLRYVQIFVPLPRVRVYYAGLLPTPYPLGGMELSTSDALHDQIARVSRRTLELCIHEHYEDCPWREQSLYAMDSRNQMLCGYYALGEYDMPRESLRLLGLSLRDDHMLELCSPARVPITIPSFSAMYLVELWEYVLFSGDRDFGREMLPAARDICDGFLAMRTAAGVMPRYEEKKDWNFYEWRPYFEGYQRMEGDEGPREDAPLTAFVCMALSAFASLLDALGEKDAGAYRNRGQEMAKAAHRAFWDENMGVYASFRGKMGRFHYAELTQALMLICGAVPEALQAQVRGRLAEGNGLVPVTIAYTVFKFDALLQDPSYADTVFGQVERDWGYMLYSGATAFWETLDGENDFNNAGSLCHGWSAVPLYLYFRYALGLYPTRPGFEKYEIRPIDCGLHAPRGAVTTRDGRRIEL